MTSSTLSENIARQIDTAVSILRSGGVVAFPTDTIYGLGANALLSSAVEKIYQVKHRPHNLPLPVLIADKSELTGIVSHIPHCASALMDLFWPGALTLVLAKSPSFPSSAGLSSIAIRIPNHPVPLALIRKLGAPLIGTSANISGSATTLTAADVKNQLGDKIDFIIDGGACPGEIVSTVVDVSSGYPVIVRNGAIPEKEIMNTVKNCDLNGEVKCV